MRKSDLKFKYSRLSICPLSHSTQVSDSVPTHAWQFSGHRTHSLKLPLALSAILYPGGHSLRHSKSPRIFSPLPSRE